MFNVHIEFDDSKYPGANDGAKGFQASGILVDEWINAANFFSGCSKNGVDVSLEYGE